MYPKINIPDEELQQRKKEPRKRVSFSRVRLPWRTSAQQNQSDNKLSEKEKIAQKKVLEEEEKNKLQAKERLESLVTSSERILFEASAVFPFDLFPDKITIEVSQVNIAKHYFYFNAQLQSIPIKNVADVFVGTSILFASLRIIDASFIENSVQVDYLNKNDACRARNIIQGLVIARKEGIDLAKIPINELQEKIEKLGKAAEIDFPAK